MVVDKLNMFFLDKPRMEMKCHRYKETDIGVFDVSILSYKNDG